MPVSVDMTGERFGAPVSIAHLAAHGFDQWDANARHIYDADAAIARDWPWEVEKVEMEYLLGVDVTFKDGSKLTIPAHGDCCEGPGSGCRHCGQ